MEKTYMVHKRKVHAFFFYADHDEKLAQQFLVFLAPLQRQEEIKVWHQGSMKAGEIFEDSAYSNLEHSNLILLFVTPDFIGSFRHYETGILRVVERQALGDALVIPIIARPCDWKEEPFGKLRPVPRHLPVTQWRHRDSAWLDVVEQVRTSIHHFTRDASGREQTHPDDVEDQTKLTFARIAIDRKNKYWLERFNYGTFAQVPWIHEEYGFTEDGCDQIFYRSEGHKGPDPSFDITLINRTQDDLILTDVGIELLMSRKFFGHWQAASAGPPRAVQVHLSATYSVDLPQIRIKQPEETKREEGWLTHHLHQVVATPIPNPIYLAPRTPYRYILRLNTYEHLPYGSQTILRMWIRTDLGQERSHKLLLDESRSYPRY